MTSRNVLVTGGSRGIGRACAEILARTGDHVVAIGRDSDALNDVAESSRLTDHSIEPYVCDITNEAAVLEMFHAVGDVDILVHSAGMSSSAAFRSTTSSDLIESFNVNVLGAFICARQAAMSMRDRGWGRLVFVASTCGLMGVPYTAAYTMAKHAVVGLMRVLASEMSGTEITANAICPTYVRSDMTDRSIARIASLTPMGPAEALATLESSSPLGRLLEPAEIAQTAAFLCSSEAVSINGQTIVMDGGGMQH